MSDFINSILNNALFRNALLIGILSSIAFGITGTFVVVKRVSGISGGIAHAVLGGVGIAYYFGFSKILGAFIFAVIAAVILGVIKLKLKEYEETIIAALWAIGMATGIIFMYKSPGYKVDLMTYLFGNILFGSTTEIYLILGLDVLIVTLVMIFYRQFISISFDEEQAKLRGINVKVLYILLLCLIATTIVLLLRVVGLILVIALITLPASISSMFAKNVSRMIIYSIGFGMFFTLSGQFVSFSANLPPGATIVISAGLGYILAIIIKFSVKHYKAKKNPV